MTIISIIAAIDSSKAIGKNNRLLCYLPNDLKHFKSTTLGHTIIMGRKTFESLPNGALPNRRNIVVSRNKNLNYKNCELADSLENAIEKCKNEDEIFIIGGGTIYNEAINIAQKLYITHIHHTFEGADTFFPNIDTKIWKEVSKKENLSDEKNLYNHNFSVYIRNRE